MWMDVPGVPDTWDMIMEKALEKKVMLLPGLNKLNSNVLFSQIDLNFT